MDAIANDPKLALAKRASQLAQIRSDDEFDELAGLFEAADGDRDPLWIVRLANAYARPHHKNHDMRKSHALPRRGDGLLRGGIRPWVSLNRDVIPPSHPDRAIIEYFRHGSNRHDGSRSWRRQQSRWLGNPSDGYCLWIFDWRYNEANAILAKRPQRRFGRGITSGHDRTGKPSKFGCGAPIFLLRCPARMVQEYAESPLDQFHVNGNELTLARGGVIARFPTPICELARWKDQLFVILHPFAPNDPEYSGTNLWSLNVLGEILWKAPNANRHWSAGDLEFYRDIVVFDEALPKVRSQMWDDRGVSLLNARDGKPVSSPGYLFSDVVGKILVQGKRFLTPLANVPPEQSQLNI